MTNGTQFYIDRARQRKARALTDAILAQYPELARSDVEGLIERLKNYTSDQWGSLARLASCNAPSMASCQIVFSNLRARGGFAKDRKPARRTYADAAPD